MASLQKEVDGGDELAEMDDANFKAEFGPPPKPPTEGDEGPKS